MSISEVRLSAKSTETTRVARVAVRGVLLSVAVLSVAALASAQTVSMFPGDYELAWTRVAIPPTNPLYKVNQWHIKPGEREIVCDGNRGHEWLRFNRELANFDFKVEWRFTPVADAPLQRWRIFPQQQGRHHLAPGADLA